MNSMNCGGDCNRCRYGGWSGPWYHSSKAECTDESKTFVPWWKIWVAPTLAEWFCFTGAGLFWGYMLLSFLWLILTTKR